MVIVRTSYILMEMQGMVRACHPILPHVGMYRQSVNLEQTLRNYHTARKRRNTVSMSYLLKQMVHNCTRYRLMRRLWIRALDSLYPELIQLILHYLPWNRRAPLRPFWSLRYDTLSVEIRMTQLAGRLQSLGYTSMILPIPDYEYEGYKLLAEKSQMYVDSTYVDVLYQSLRQKRIVDKWPILSSYIYDRSLHLAWTKEDWLTYCTRERLTLYLNACIRIHALNPIEIQLLTDWISRMKYPSIGTDW